MSLTSESCLTLRADMTLNWQKLVKYHLALNRDPASSSVTARFSRVTANLPSAQPTAPRTGFFKIDNDGLTIV